MPELPEVEITRRGIDTHLTTRVVTDVVIRNASLRYRIPDDFAKTILGQHIKCITRRAKYLLLESETGAILIHLGMSGSLRVLPLHTPAEKHDHVDIVFGTQLLRLRDPRRFGAVLWVPHPVLAHSLLAHLGAEPLTEDFNDEIFYDNIRSRTTPIKLLIMDAHLVVGVGNIYASESLFRAGIHPQTPGKDLSKKNCQQLVSEIKATLTQALENGGSTLRDFVGSDGRPGYFQQQYTVYGREGEACRICGTPIERIEMGQRSSFFCPHCQKSKTSVRRGKTSTKRSAIQN